MGPIKDLDGTTRDNVITLFAMQYAHARMYLTFANVARQECFPEIADLFDSCSADAITIAHQIWALFHEKELSVTVRPEVYGQSFTTETALQTTCQVEDTDINNLLPDFVKTAKSEGYTHAAELFDELIQEKVKLVLLFAETYGFVKEYNKLQICTGDELSLEEQGLDEFTALVRILGEPNAKTFAVLQIEISDLLDQGFDKIVIDLSESEPEYLLHPAGTECIRWFVKSVAQLDKENTFPILAFVHCSNDVVERLPGELPVNYATYGVYLTLDEFLSCHELDFPADFPTEIWDSSAVLQAQDETNTESTGSDTP